NAAYRFQRIKGTGDVFFWLSHRKWLNSNVEASISKRNYSELLMYDNALQEPDNPMKAVVYIMLL
ncbi:hypothetical protein, partial [Enterobacter cloacae]|uniref:hypothetical protein n=1 Tax=Enterobacter cloacae TaxID=550 RepID=UPI001C8D5866